MILLLLYVLILCNTTYAKHYSKEQSTPEYGLIRVPVADATGSPQGSIGKYNKMAFALEKGAHGCPRFHQLLFNEVIKILQERGEEIEAEISNVFYVDILGRQTRNFWTLKKNIVKLKDIKNKNALFSIPKTYTDDIKTNTTLTLRWPWYDLITKKFYSAGTRFVRVPEKDTNTAYGIKLLNNSLSSVDSLVKKPYAVVSYPSNNEKKIKNFIALLKFWVAQNEKNNAHIPYVWGGCSFIRAYDDNFWLQKDKQHGAYAEYWMRPEKTKPYTGLECSSLIFRAAQICGMPYYLKNSSTIAAYLKPITSKDTIQDGDIIWYPGHVIVISDIKNNQIIEAAGYMLGFGKTHELPLEKVFKNIKTCDQLKRVFHNKAQLVRLDINGKDFKRIKQITLLKIRSIWPKKD